MKFLASLAKEVERLRQEMQTLDVKKAELARLQAHRAQLLRDFRAGLVRIYNLRVRLATRLEARLRETVLEMNIAFSYLEGRFAPDAEEALKDAMAWRTAAVPKAPALIRALGVPVLLEAVRRGDMGAIAATRGPHGEPILSEREAHELVERLSTWEARRPLEECWYGDLPRIIVTRPAAPTAEPAPDARRPAPISRSFSQLSLGQQQSIVLAILLCSESRAPLIIDQPEDNLDSAFVYRILVRSLRRIKEHRQVILVTHNANIAVLADSDLILPLKAVADRGCLVNPGTVEAQATRDLVCEILEGGRAAYEHRGRLYGLPER
ncbi:MAG: AAA family ATPase [Deltaproteobacteria bacterium]|nr:AAA family ATPase [Deltaproteobacteria bacterium]